MKVEVRVFLGAGGWKPLLTGERGAQRPNSAAVGLVQDWAERVGGEGAWGFARYGCGCGKILGGSESLRQLHASKCCNGRTKRCDGMLEFTELERPNASKTLHDVQ